MAGRRKEGVLMFDYIIAILLIVLFFANIVVSIWVTKQNLKENKLKTTAIYCLYTEIKRMNDNLIN